VSGCNNFALAKAGDTCFDFAGAHGISTGQLYAWNPVLGLNGANCSTNFWASEYYCIGIRAAATSTAPATAPGPTQSGIVSNCDNFAQAADGDTCDVFASRNMISNAQLYAWNAVLGSSGQNCQTMLWAKEWYCVGISAPPATPTTPVPAPGPTQTGIIASCVKYAMAVDGDSCDVFASRNGVSNAQLYTWNTVLGANGANCGTNLWAKEYYCVGIASS
jgi:LysM repeat protein